MTKSCQYVLFSVLCKILTMYISSSDIDILCHWLNHTKPSRVSSFGSLRHFRKQAKPQEAGAATRCFDCPIEQDCAYSAKKSMTTTSSFCVYADICFQQST